MLEKWFDALFLEHPRSLGLSYTAHAYGSLSLAANFAWLSAQAVVHAVVPRIFQKSSSTGIEEGLPRKLAELRSGMPGYQ